MLGIMRKKTSSGRGRTPFRGPIVSVLLSVVAGSGAAVGVQFLEYPEAAAVAAGVVAAAIVGGISLLIGLHLLRRSLSGPELKARMAAASADADLLADLQSLVSASSRKNWADMASARIARMTGSSGAAILLRIPGTDSLSLAGSTTPLVIRNLDAVEAAPHGPGRRAVSTGEPVVMSTADIPAWAAAAGFEAGAALPVLHHGQAIGLAYALGKSWQTPRKDALDNAVRFLGLAATHYAVAAPFAVHASYGSAPEPGAAATAHPLRSAGPVRNAERVSTWPTRQAPAPVSPARPAPATGMPGAVSSSSTRQPIAPATPGAAPRSESRDPTPATVSTSRWLPRPVVAGHEDFSDAPSAAARSEPAKQPEWTTEVTPARKVLDPIATPDTEIAPSTFLPVGQTAAAARAAAEEAARTGTAFDMSAQRRRLDLPGIALDPRTERCVVDGNALSLSKTEFDLLYALAARNGEITPGSELVSAVWGDSTAAPGNALDVTIHRLRRKLSRVPGGSELVKTVRGKGYALTLAS